MKKFIKKKKVVLGIKNLNTIEFKENVVNNTLPYTAEATLYYAGSILYAIVPGGESIEIPKDGYLIIEDYKYYAITKEDFLDNFGEYEPKEVKPVVENIEEEIEEVKEVEEIKQKEEPKIDLINGPIRTKRADLDEILTPEEEVDEDEQPKKSLMNFVRSIWVKI